MISAKIVADSISPEGKRITTMELVYPRLIHAENKTHRILSSDSEDEIFTVTQSTGLMDCVDLSRNASSSRAIPVAKMIEMVRNNHAMPIHWGKNQPGMQAKEELTGDSREHAIRLWNRAANHAANIAEEMMGLGLHKQVVNRILEPYQHIHVIVTATEWDNFFELREHPDAQPEIHELAVQMRQAMNGSIPVRLGVGEWHLPYVTAEDHAAAISHLRGDGNILVRDWMIDDLLRKVSAARCCRVSYLKHDGTKATIEEEIALCDRLAGARPIHASPFEHQATPDERLPNNGLYDKWSSPDLHGNLVGWIQNRKLVEKLFAA